MKYNWVSEGLLDEETERVRSQIFYRTLRGSAEVIVAIFVTFLPLRGKNVPGKEEVDIAEFEMVEVL